MHGAHVVGFHFALVRSLEIGHGKQRRVAINRDIVNMFNVNYNAQ